MADRAFTIIDVPQHLEDGSANPDWLAARVARVTGSTADAMLAESKSNTQRTNLTIRLAVERLTGRHFDKDFQSRAMEQGLARESDARCAYECETGHMVMEVGFCKHTELFAGCSPDGQINDFEGLVSIKCPDFSAHSDALDGKTISLKYRRQIAHELWVTGAQWCDYVSYNPDFGDGLSLVVIRIARDETAMQEHDKAVRAFLAEVEAKYLALKTRRSLSATLTEAVA